MLIGNASETAPIRVSLHHNLWGPGVDQRMPLATRGHVHLYNNVFAVTGNTEGTVASDLSQFLAERNVYTGVNNPLLRRNVNTALAIGRILALENVYTSTTGTAPYAGTDDVFTPPYSYEALPTSDVATVVNASAGNIAGGDYTDDATGTATITAPASTVTTGSSITLTAVPAGVTPTAYQWRRNNIAIAGTASATFTLPSVLPSDAVTYTVALSLGSGDWVVSQPFTLSVNNLPLTPPAGAQASGKGGGGSPSIWFLTVLAALIGIRMIFRQRQ